jgi:hypothetical protein
MTDEATAPDASAGSFAPPGGTGPAADTSGYGEVVTYASAAALDSHEAAVSAIATVDPDLASALAGTWGADLRTNLSFAHRAAEALATPELVAEVERAGLGNSPHLVRALAAIGRRLAVEAGDPLTVPTAQELSRMTTTPPAGPAAPAAGFRSLDEVQFAIDEMSDELGGPKSIRESWQKRWNFLFEEKVRLEGNGPAAARTAPAAASKALADMQAEAARRHDEGTYNDPTFQARLSEAYRRVYG